MTGYSGTPLAKKLGIKVASRIFLCGAPKNYLKLVAPLPEGVLFVPKIDAETDIAHIFTSRKAELAEVLRATLTKLRRNGIVWVSWPKKTSKLQSDVTEDAVRAIALPLGLVDIKVCAVDNVWSGLKLVWRKENR